MASAVFAALPIPSELAFWPMIGIYLALAVILLVIGRDTD